uniref:[histone H3]-trimethyl-L-lysine(9) demethylase n=1 Tax=Neogobius melanostomus TaxID=47308 RepID=A0A8C6SYW3_9GOBI
MEAPSQNHSSKGIMTFHPTVEEFTNFTRYIAYMESQGAHKAGLAKIVPPKEWKPRMSYDNIDDLVIPAPIQQVVTGQSGLFTQYNIQKKAMSLREFRKIASSDKFCCPHYDDFEDLERKYWKNVTFNPPIYGADVNGSLYDPNVKEWNICNLGSILDTVESESGITIEGVNTPYLYFGMWKTTFAWHTEDMDLYSINYLHFGEPKSWYCIPPEHGKRLERLAKGFFPGSAQNCEAFLRHKMTLISPSILKKYGIPFEKITQKAGEFIVTFPYSYHAGFNHGFNCAESTNFATERWIEYGKQAILCSCRKDMVKISMDVFVRKYQPERYAQWLAGRDVVSIDHSRPTPEAREFLGESSDVGSLYEASTPGCKGNGDCKRLLQSKVCPEATVNEHKASPSRESVEDVRVKVEEQSDIKTSRSEELSGLSETDSSSATSSPTLTPIKVEANSRKVCRGLGAHTKTNEEWAQPLSDLWQHRPVNPTAEREYNQRMSQQPPYCSICLIFYTYHQVFEMHLFSLTRGNCQWSKPLIPEVCFNTQSTRGGDGVEGQLSNPYIAEDGTSRLVTCKRCCVRVHTSKRTLLQKYCCIDKSSQWVHVLCAITVLEARFINVSQRRPVDLSTVPLQRFRLKCALCRTRLTAETCGCCVQCSHGRCSTAFHPTCAQAAGILMHPDDWPFIVFITCQRHRRTKMMQKDLKVGQRVICKHKNGRYYHSDVSALTTATFYEVVFDDGSYSDNLFPEDIVDRDCALMGPPAEGDPVQVRWTDGLLYGAKFIAAHSDPMFLVVFEDGSQVSAKPEDIYTLDEDLPKRVKSRMSVASDQRFQHFTEPKVRENSKRQRMINSRYKEDYIEPSIYRTIME